MKILFIQKEGGIFGAEQYQLKIIPGLIAQGIHIEFLRLFTEYQGGQGGTFIDRLNEIGVKTYEINIGRYPSLGKLGSIHTIIVEGEYDIIHSHLIHADLYAALIKKFYRPKVKFVSTKHGYDNTFTSKYGFDATKQKLTAYFAISKFAEGLMDKSFTISHGLRNFFVKTGLTTAEKMEMIHYGFDLDDVAIEKPEDYRCFKKQIVIAGRLVKFKGHVYLLEALAYILKQDSEVGLIILGSGKEEGNIKATIDSLGIQHRVKLLGYSSEVQQYMCNSDVVAITSISEGFGVVFLEAFNSHTPVVAFNVPAGNELMQHGETGYLVKPYDIEALGERIIEIFKNPKEAAEVADKAYERLKEYFTLQRMIKQTISFYKSL